MKDRHEHPHVLFAEQVDPRDRFVQADPVERALALHQALEQAVAAMTKKREELAKQICRIDEVLSKVSPAKTADASREDVEKLIDEKLGSP